MIEEQKKRASGRRFAGIEIPADLKRSHFLSLYLATLLTACITVFASFIQPLFLNQVIGIPEDQAGSINSGLQNVSQIITLFLVGLVGIVSDKVGRRRLTIAGFLIAGTFYIIFGYAREISLALGIVGVGGQILIVYGIKLAIGLGFILCYPQFITMVADYTLPRDRGKGMAYNGVMMSLGAFIIFGVLAQVAVDLPLMTLFYIIGSVAFLGACIAYFGLVDRMPAGKPGKLGFRAVYRIVSNSLSLKASYLTTGVARADVAVISTLVFVWVVYAAEDYGMDPLQASAKGAMVILSMALATFITFPVVGMLLDRIGRVPVLTVSLLTGGVGFCLMALITNPFSPFMYVLAGLVGIGFAGSVAGANTLTSDAAPKPILGSIMGGMNTMQPIGVLFFLQLGGYLFDTLGSWAPFALKGLADVACGLWIFSLRKRIGPLQNEDSRQP
jgi:MFS family permease